MGFLFDDEDEAQHSDPDVAKALGQADSDTSKSYLIQGLAQMFQGKVNNDAFTGYRGKAAKKADGAVDAFKGKQDAAAKAAQQKMAAELVKERIMSQVAEGQKTRDNSNAQAQMGRDAAMERAKVMAAGSAQRAQMPKPYEYTDDSGNELIGQVVGGQVVKSPGDQVKKPAAADSSKNYRQSADKADQISTYLEEQLKLFDGQGDDKARIVQGRGMLKGMNSVFGPDAIGKDEASRLGGALEFGFDPATKGIDPRPSVPTFRQQIADQIASQKAVAAQHRKMIGGGASGGGGGKTEVKRQRSKNDPSKVKVIYSDGSEEVISDGQ